MIIGITGLKFSGKSSIGDILEKYCNFTKIAFGDPLKDAVCTMFNWNRNQVELCKEKIDPKYGISYRQALTSVGNDWAQHLLPDTYEQYNKCTGRLLWVINCFNRIDALRKDAGITNFCITDVRYHFEVNAIRSNGGKIIKVIRDSVKGINTENHESESYIKDIRADIETKNNGTLDELKNVTLESIKVLGL